MTTVALDHLVRFETEAQLVAAVTLRLRNDFRTVRLGLEVRSHGRSRADIAAVIRDHDGKELLLGVEAKLFDWRRALQQAALNRYVVQASFVALPRHALRSDLLAAAEEHGVGVLTMTSDRMLSVVLPALRACPDGRLHERVLGQLPRVRGRGMQASSELVKGAVT